MRYDFECEQCGWCEERALTWAESHQPQWCPRCGLQMTKLPPTGTGFVIKGFAAKNGYSNG